ncbi:MAG: DNA-binding response regulator [Bacteroidetes bacterium]|nr:MAG: DNA-binding response regulator [Bacteroidota bacterium]MBL1143494.1 DNA-binding response regulator [Bacteroidota bacterium]NOG56297.1 response regulator transcription factor [Bacteroidota bacterium]
MTTKDLKVLVVEDEKVLAFVVEEMLQEYEITNTVVANTYNDGLKWIDPDKIDLALLDINLGAGLSGIDLAIECTRLQIPFIYLTSYTDKKMLDLALKTTPGGYVVKPVSPAALYSAIKIVFNKTQEQQYFYNFKDGTKNVRLNVNAILYIQADGIYSNIVTTDRKYLVRTSITAALADLPKEYFIQVHRSYIVNIKFVSSYKRNIIFINEIQIPLSRSFKTTFRETIS